MDQHNNDYISDDDPGVVGTESEAVLQPAGPNHQKNSFSFFGAEIAEELLDGDESVPQPRQAAPEAETNPESSQNQRAHNNNKRNQQQRLRSLGEMEPFEPVKEQPKQEGISGKGFSQNADASGLYGAVVLEQNSEGGSLEDQKGSRQYRAAVEDEYCRLGLAENAEIGGIGTELVPQAQILRRREADPSEDDSPHWEYRGDYHSATSDLVGRNLKALGGKESLRLKFSQTTQSQTHLQRERVTRREEEDDQPSLQSPAHRLQEYSPTQAPADMSFTRTELLTKDDHIDDFKANGGFDEQEDQNERIEIIDEKNNAKNPNRLQSTEEQYTIPHVIKGPRHQHPCRPMSVPSIIATGEGASDGHETSGSHEAANSASRQDPGRAPGSSNSKAHQAKQECLHQESNHLTDSPEIKPTSKMNDEHRFPEHERVWAGSSSPAGGEHVANPWHCPQGFDKNQLQELVEKQAPCRQVASMNRQDCESKQMQDGLESLDCESISQDRADLRRGNAGIDTAAGSGGQTQDHPLDHRVIQHQKQASWKVAGLHKSEHKVNKGREILEMSERCQPGAALMGSGLIAANQLQAVTESLDFSGAKTPVKATTNQMTRSRSHAHQAYSGCVAPAEVQAHMDKLRLRQHQQHALSPFRNSHTQHPHFESLYHLQYPQLSPFNGAQLVDSMRRQKSQADLAPSTPETSQSMMKLDRLNRTCAADPYSDPYSAARNNPMAQSMSLPLGLAQSLQGTNLKERDSLNFRTQATMGAHLHQLLSSSLPGQPGTGHQYEVLLREKADLQNGLHEQKRAADEQRRAANQLKAQETRLKFELTEKAEDLEEALQKLAERETRLQEVKETSRRQNEQIDQLRSELNAMQDKDKQTSSLKKRNLDLEQQVEQLKKDLESREKARRGEPESPSGLPDERCGKGPQDQLRAKTKEIYSLTVELGCIREENNELKKNIEMQRDDFQERLGEQRKRSDEEFHQLQEEFEVLQIESSEAQRVGAAKITELTVKLELQGQEQRGHIDKLDQQLRAKIEECALQKQNIDQLTAKHDLLNKQLDSLREELEKSKTTRKQVDEEWAPSGIKTGPDSSRQRTFYDQAQCSKPMTDKAWRGDVRRTSNQEEQQKAGTAAKKASSKDPNERKDGEAAEDVMAQAVVMGSLGQASLNWKQAKEQSHDSLKFPGNNDVAGAGGDDETRRPQQLSPATDHSEPKYPTDNIDEKLATIEAGSGRDGWGVDGSGSKGPRHLQSTKDVSKVPKSQVTSTMYDTERLLGNRSCGKGTNARELAKHRASHVLPWLPVGKQSDSSMVFKQECLRDAPRSSVLSQRSSQKEAIGNYRTVESRPLQRGHQWTHSGGSGEKLKVAGNAAASMAAHRKGGAPNQQSPGYLLDDGSSPIRGRDGPQAAATATESDSFRPTQQQLDQMMAEGICGGDYGRAEDHHAQTGHQTLLSLRSSELHPLEAGQIFTQEDRDEMEQLLQGHRQPVEIAHGEDHMSHHHAIQERQESSDDEAPFPRQSHQIDDERAGRKGESIELGASRSRGSRNQADQESESQVPPECALQEFAAMMDPADHGPVEVARCDARRPTVNGCASDECNEKIEDELNSSSSEHGTANACRRAPSKSAFGRNTGMGAKTARARTDLETTWDKNLVSSVKPGGKAGGMVTERSGPAQPPNQLGASLQPQHSSQVISTTRNPGNNLKWKRTSNFQSTIRQRPSLMSSGPTGPLGLGSRLITQRRKQTTAASAIAEMAPMRSARTGAGAGVTSSGRNNASTKSIGKQLLSSSMMNTSQSSLRSSVVGAPHWSKVSGKTSQAAQQKERSAKALHSASGVWGKELNQSQFGATTNFSQSAVTARQLQTKSPRPPALGASERTGPSKAGQENLQLRAQEHDKAGQPKRPKYATSGASTSRVYARPSQSNQNGLPGPLSDASNRQFMRPHQQVEGHLTKALPAPPTQRTRLRNADQVMYSNEGPLRNSLRDSMTTSRNREGTSGPRNLENRAGSSAQAEMAVVASGNEQGQVVASSSRRDGAESDQRGAKNILMQPESAASQESLASRPSDDDPHRAFGKKESLSDMRVKLQSIQTGKAYLEKKIQEYETRLSQMKIKKDGKAKQRGDATTASNNQQNQAAQHSHREQLPAQNSRSSRARVGTNTGKPHLF